MTNLLNILNNLAVKILQDKGQLTMFSLAKLSDSKGWDLLIVADWCQTLSVEAFKYLYSNFRKEQQKYVSNMNKEDKNKVSGEILEFLEFPFIILPKESNLVMGLRRLYIDKPIHIKPVAIEINTSRMIQEIYLFATDTETQRKEFQFLEYGRERIQDLTV